MKSFNKFLLAGAMALSALTPIAAQRYMTPQFTTVNRVDDVAYGRNFSVIALSVTGRMRGDSLRCDVYTPAGDAMTNRPLMIYLHTGNFLPQSVTQSPMGNKQDSTCIEICNRFARLGYVAASATYRLGWIPNDADQARRTNTLINAAYRGVQDARTAVRFFKANAAAYGIDSNKIMVVGQGTGGYIGLAMASLDNYTKTVLTQFPVGKFIQGTTPMVIEQIPGQTPAFYVNGDVEGKVLGRTPPGTGPVPPALDTLCIPNHVAPSSKIQFLVNLGGAVGDLSWIDRNTCPIVSFQTPYDPFAPYTSAVLRVPVAPGVSLPVVEVQGAFDVQKRMDSLGINNIFNSIKPAFDPNLAMFTARRGATSNYKGLFPSYGTAGNLLDSSPWDFWSAANPYNANGLISQPDMSPAKSKRYIDTIMSIVIPRACVALKLPCASTVTGSAEELLSENAYKIQVSPNPATDVVTFASEATNPIQSVQIFDLSGRMVQEYRNVNAEKIQVARNGMAAGMYVAKLKFEGGIIAKRFVFEN